MKMQKYALLLGLILLLGVLAGCAAPAAPTGAEPAADTPAAEPTEAPAAEAEPAEFAPTSVAAENCDYGGKILSIEAVDALTVKFSLCSTDPAFLAKVAFMPFAIQPAEHIAATGGGGELLETPIGTGAYMLDSWERGNQITLKRFDDYWGEPATAATAVLRWNQEGAARLLELQSGTADMIPYVNQDDYETVEGDASLQLLPNHQPNVFYVGMNNTKEPFDDLKVRQAMAMGIDRQRIVDNFFAEGSEVASHFAPCTIPNGCEGEAWYDFDPEAARQLLAEAGFPDGFATKLFYRDVVRPYLPEPSVVAVELQTQLKENLNIDAEVVVMESGQFIADATEGNLDGIWLLGWGADYPHLTNFLDFHFGETSLRFGTPQPEIYEKLLEGSQIADSAQAAPVYEAANNAIRELIPMVPISHAASASAARADVEGAYEPPFGFTQLQFMKPGDRDIIVYMEAAEPISLYCSDETDGETLRACSQIVEPLLRYEKDKGDTIPALATGCTGNADATEWVCTLREGVTFHDGSSFDANDVVASWAAGIDAANPNHVGNTGAFAYYSSLWDKLINAPPAE